MPQVCVATGHIRSKAKIKMAFCGIQSSSILLNISSNHPAMHGILRQVSSCTYIPLDQNRRKIKFPPLLGNRAFSLRQSRSFHLSKTSTLNNSYISKLNLAHPLDLCVLMTRNRNSLVSTAKSFIHNQTPSGDKQADHHFNFSAKGLYKASPESWKPYLNLIRLDRPIGTWLLFLPCTWSISLSAAPGCLPDLHMLSLFAMGSFFMRGAGCTINDMWDKDFDAKVARTKDRPLACGKLSYFNALTFLGVQLSASLGILLTMNWNTVFLGAAAMIPVVVYPLMKRITYWPQIFLGLTFNWGAFMGWSAIHGSCDLAVCLPLYASGIAWTLVYDTIYAHQDKDDDILVGVKSTALKLGDQTKPWLLGFGTVMVGGLTTTGLMCDQTLPYFIGVGGVAAHLLHQIWTVDLNNSEDCASKFRSNYKLGLWFWGMIVLANLMKKDTEVRKPDVPQVNN